MPKIEKIKLPVLITRGAVCFPGNDLVVYCERSFSINAVIDSTKDYNSLVFLTTQKDIDKNEIETIDDIYNIGTLCKISFKIEQKDVIKTSLHALERYKFSKLTLENECYYIEGNLYEDEEVNEEEEQAVVTSLIQTFNNKPIDQFVNPTNKNFFENVKKGLSAKELSYLFSNELDLEPKKKQELLECKNVIERIKTIIEDISILEIRRKADIKVQQNLKEINEKAQKDYYLRSQMMAIKKELGDDGQDSESKYRKLLASGKYPKEVVDKVNDELKRMNTLPQGTLEYSLILDYLDTLFAMPFSNETKDNDDLIRARKILDDDHYGLEKAKERIIEYLAIKKVNGNLKAPVLCFYGPPGTGKTSLSISIAKALGRKFVKCSLGGISDESEIRGHRRTYVGSKPGRIMSFMKKAGTINPLICLDEIDKLSHDSFKGDPSAALLEVLDPEQNTHFRDNYLEIEYDLSNVLFVCTCNYLENVPEPLRDRLELIPIESYTLIEKVRIAEQHLIKKEASQIGLDSKNIKISKDAIEFIIEHYTREAGVRELSRKIGSILRKVIVQQLNSNTLNEPIKIGIKDVKKFLGVEIFESTDKEKKSQVGIVTGLAYTQFGGDILPIEVNHFEGTGKLIITGNLGDIMKESCSIALDYVKANAEKYGISNEFFNKNDIHIHVPEGAVPKDGPSAGIAITTAIISALTQKPVSNDVAMTGEVNLRGNALPIGGLREKSLAALRSGIKTIIVPKGNKKNISELPKDITNNLNVIYMDNVDDALKVCLM